MSVNMVTESNKRKDAPDTADQPDLPVCKRFCADDAAIVRKDAKHTPISDENTRQLLLGLSRVPYDDMKRMSDGFQNLSKASRDVDLSQADARDLTEHACVLEQVLLLTDLAGDEQLDVRSLHAQDLLGGHRAALRYEMANVLEAIELGLRYVYRKLIAAL